MARDNSEMDFNIYHIFKTNLDVSCVGQKRDLSKCSTTQPVAFPVQKKATKHYVTVNNLAKTAIERWEEKEHMVTQLIFINVLANEFWFLVLGSG